MLHPPGLLQSVPLTPWQATVDSCLCWRLPNTHRQAWLSLLWGHCSFLLGPGEHKVLFVPSKSLFPQSCVSSGVSVVGLMATSSKRAYAIPRSVEPRAPAPLAGHCWFVLLQETLIHSSGSVSVGSLGPGVHRVCWALWVSLGGMRFDSKNDFAPPVILLWVFLCPPVNACSAVSYYFGVLTGEDELTSFYSAILETQPQKIWDSSHFPLSSAFPTWKLHLPWIHPWPSNTQKGNY